MRRPTRALVLLAALGMLLSAFIFGSRPIVYADGPPPTPTPAGANGAGGGGHGGG